MKFSFKKGAGGEKADKPKGKRKSRGGGDGMASAKAMLANHGEKVLLGLVAVVSLYVIYSGFKQEGLKSSPSDVQSAVQQARNKMEAPTWTEVKQVRYPEPDNFDQLASDDTRPLKAEDFQLKMPMHPVLQEQRQRRMDPELLAPLEIEVRPGYGAIAVKGDGDSGRSAVGNLIGNNDDTRSLPDKIRDRMRGQSMSGSNTESRYFVSITGLVPAKAQQDLFRAAFERAIEYQIERDSPQYVALDIERREVDASGSPSEWTSLDAPRKLRLEPENWDSKIEERALKDHVIAPVMMALPPVIMRDISEWSVHSKIPQAELDASGFVRERDDRADAPAVEEREESFNIFGRDAASSERGRGEVSNEDTSDRGDERNIELVDQLKVEFGMLRFFDFDVQPGKVYEYRARLLLEDPNNPHSFAMPSAGACETAVIIRRQANPDDYVLESPWSEASSPVRIPSGRQVFAGKVVAPNASPVAAANGLISLPKKSTDEPVATMMGVAWDPVKKVDVPAPLSVRRGSVVNKSGTEVEVVDPTISKVRKLRGYDFATNVIVVDIAGGDLVDRRADVRAPGLVLVMDENNNISLRSEIDDVDRYEFFEIPPDEELLLQQQERERAEENERRDGRRERGGADRGRGRGGRNDRGGGRGERGNRGGENNFSQPGFGPDRGDGRNRPGR